VNENAPQPRRLLAAYCLGQMRHAPAAEALRHVMWNDTGELAYACVDALYWLDDPRSLEDWVRLTENADPWVLAYATAALARSGAQESIEPLYAIASGQNPAPPEVQRQALAGLAAWPGSVSVPYLINILRSNQRIQPETINALRKVAQVDVGRYPASWFEWYRQWSEVQAVAGQEEGSAPPLMPSQGDSELLNTVKFVPPGFSPGAN
jgi:HEAT repeat protein